ncbi:MAG TPA: nuclear transport factor 2 family protein [Terriglobales bacterium]|jgi:ketosteroid isomerase-like protein|nr:nuclear transport factor 2 family protein [Terriglobales bacterium]
MTGERRSNRDALLRSFEILNTGEYEKLDDVIDKDVITEWPQSGELLRGLENYRSVLRNYPGGRLNLKSNEQLIIEGDKERYLLTPMYTMVKVEGTGDSLTATVKTRYPDGSDWYINEFLTFRDGKIVKQVMYFAPVYEAPEWRSQWVELMEGGS